MPPESTDRLVEFPLPVRGMATDLAPHALPAGYSPLIHNYIPGEPGQMRLRKRLTPFANFRSRLTAASQYTIEWTGTGPASWASTTGLSTTGSVPVGVMVYGNDVLLSFAQSEAARAPQPNTIALPPSVTYGVVGSAIGRIMHVDLATGTVTDLFSSTDVTDANVRTYLSRLRQYRFGTYTTWRPLTWGTGVRFNDRVYGLTPAFQSASEVKNGLLCWGGAMLASGTPAGTVPTTITCSFTNGATTGTTTATATQIGDLNLFMPGLLLQESYSGSTTQRLMSYRVVNITTGGVVTLAEPYGKGFSTAVVPDAVGTTFVIEPMVDIAAGRPSSASSAYVGSTALNVFQSRLFRYRGYLPGVDAASFYDNLVAWSAAGNGDYWPAENYTLIDDAQGDMLVGAVMLGDRQLIFSTNSTYVMDGYDEDSFNIDTLTRATGCVDQRSIVEVDDRVFWTGEDGVWSWSGNGLPKQESHPNSSVGIRSFLKPHLKRADGTNSLKDFRHVAAGRIKNRLVWCGQNHRRATARQPLVFDAQTNAWAIWGIGTTAEKATTSDDFMVPYFFFNSADARSFAVGPSQMWETTSIFDEPNAVSDEQQPTSVAGVDQYYDGSDVLQSVPLTGTIQFADLIMNPGMTTRLSELTVHHCSLADVSGGTSANAFDVYLSADYDPRSSTSIKTVPARLSTGASERKNYGLFYTDRVMSFGSGVNSLDGAVFRLKLDKPNSSGYECKIANIVYGVYGKMRVVRESRIDSTAT